MNNITTQPMRRRGKKKVTTTASSSQNKQTVQSVIPQEETPESRTRIHIANKIVSISIEDGMEIFGSYVREYMCRRPFDLELSDIDIFSIHDVKHFVKLAKEAGFRIEFEKAEKNKYHGRDRAFDVYHCTLGMMNDEFFLGKKVEIKVDYVKGPLNSRPPFQALDFECNAWIWDRYGIRLSQTTGTDMDKMSARDIKDHEGKILADSKALRTVYYPLDKPGEPSIMDGLDIYRRKLRANRIIKMLKRGWTITNIDGLVQSQANPNDICVICQNALEGPCIKMPCCVSKYHYDCFETYAKSELDERSHIRCLQRCKEIYV